MAGHGGSGGGGSHGGGGGSGSGNKKKGILQQISSNGCLRYFVLLVIALLLLIGASAASSLGLLAKLGLPSLPAATSSNTSSTTNSSATTASVAVAAQPAAAPAAPAAVIQPASSTGGGTAGQAPANLQQLQSLPLPSTQQGALITPYIFPAFYIVRARDSLETIATQTGITADALRSYNRLTSDQLLINQILYLPPTTFNPVPNTGRNAGKDTNAPSNDNGNGQ